MRRPVKIAAATWLALFMIAGQAHAAERSLTPDQRAQRVRYETLQAPHSTTTEVVKTIVAAANRFGVSSSTMLCIARRESGLDERAYNPSGASGLFQHMRRFWPGRVRAYNAGVGPLLKIHANASPFSMRANSVVAARMIRHGGYGPWGGGC